MTLKDERPAVPRRTPRPAPDAARDPVDFGATRPPAAAVQAESPSRVDADQDGGVANETTTAPPTSTEHATEKPAASTGEQSSAPAAPTPQRERDLTVQLNISIGLKHRDLFDDVVKREGVTKRVLMERMIAEYNENHS